MKKTNYTEMKKADNPHGISSAKLYDTKHALIMHLLLKPNESLKPHITPVDVAFYVLEGEPAIFIGEEKETFKKDDLIESPKDIVHCIYNETDKIVRVLVMKLPKPTSPTKFV
jgi:quercetin dioxygenase-like cupin family protein